MKYFTYTPEKQKYQKRRKMIIFAKIYRYKSFFCNKVQKMIIKSRFSCK